MKSKEEIFNEILASVKDFEGVYPGMVNDIWLGAMSQYAKQQAVGFLIDTTGDMFKHNADELYKQYLNKNK